MEVVASSTTGCEMADVAAGRPRGGFVRAFFDFCGEGAIFLL